MRRLARIHVEHKDGRVIKGTTTDDGLQDMWAVTDDEGKIHYISVLWNIVSWVWEN